MPPTLTTLFSVEKKNGSTCMVIKYSLSHMISRSFHVKLAEVSVHEFIRSDHTSGILHLPTLNKIPVFSYNYRPDPVLFWRKKNVSPTYRPILFFFFQYVSGNTAIFYALFCLQGSSFSCKTYMMYKCLFASELTF